MGSNGKLNLEISAMLSFVQMAMPQFMSPLL